MLFERQDSFIHTSVHVIAQEMQDSIPSSWPQTGRIAVSADATFQVQWRVIDNCTIAHRLVCHGFYNRSRHPLADESAYEWQLSSPYDFTCDFLEHAYELRNALPAQGPSQQ